MANQVSRRYILQLMGSTSLLALAGCETTHERLAKPSAEAVLQQTPGIDVHCHIFNARDIPVVRFLEQVELPETGLTRYSELDKPLQRRIEFLGHGIEALAKGYAEEMAALDDVEAHPEREFAAEYDFPTLAQFSVACNKRAEEIGKPGISHFSFLDRNVFLPIGELFGVVDALLDWIRLLGGFRFRLVRELSALFASDNVRLNLYTPATVDYDLWLGENSLPMKRQIELYARISRLPGRDFLLNGFMGFDPLRQALYEEVNRHIDTLPPARRPPKLQTPLQLLQEAVLRNGFVGAKLYPPMGFQPIGNEELRRGSFDEIKPRLWELISILPPAKIGVDHPAPLGTGQGAEGGAIVHPQEPGDLDDRVSQTLAEFPREKFEAFFAQLGPRLDAALHQLYRWCVEEDVAIMAHCSNSQGANINPSQSTDPAVNFGLRADPAHWKRVLDYTEGGTTPYKALRLNIGHFGGIWNKSMSDQELDANSNGAKRAKASQDWPRVIIDILSDERYPNVYTDMADWSEAALSAREASRYSPAADRAFRFLKDEAGKRGGANARFLSRIMYGTDWIMLGRATDVADYLRGLVTRFEAAFDSPATIGFFRRNAVTFLGLQENSKCRARLEAFYAGHERHLGILRELGNDPAGLGS